MQPAVFSSVADLERRRGERVGESAWLTITQPMVDAFAELTNDRQWIHVDPERAQRESPLGGTVAHGFLTLSLLSSFIEHVVRLPTARLSLNYGFERVRFVSPVRVGADIRGAFTVHEVRAIEGGAQVTWSAEVEVRGAGKPALVAEWLTRILFAPSALADDGRVAR